MDKNNKKNNWWKIFWGTIIVLFIFYSALNITASKKLTEMQQQRKDKIEDMVKIFKQKFPEFTELQKNLTAQSIQTIKEYINEEVDKAYAPIYTQIDNFTNFHFSVTGEYSELFTMVFGDVNTILQKQIFGPAHFNENLNTAFYNINNKTLFILKEQLSKIKNKVKDKMDLNDDEVNYLFSNIIKITQTDMINRFTDIQNNTFRGFGLGSGAMAGAILAKLISKIIAKKIITKLAIKAGAKVASAGAGAAVGAESGLVCGPGAWLCSPVGAVVGGVIGWFASDKIIIEVDKYYNANNFKKDLRNLIDKSKNQTKQTLYKIYTGSLQKLSNQNQQKFKNIKSLSLKEIILK